MLQWLTEQIGKLAKLVETFEKKIKAARNIAEELYFVVPVWINRAIGGIRKDFETRIKQATNDNRGYLISLLYSFYNDLRKLIETVEKRAGLDRSNILLLARGYADKLYQTALARLDKETRPLRSWIAGNAGKLEKLWDWYNKKAAKVIDRAEPLGDYLRGGRFDRLRTLIDDLFPLLLDISRDPTGFVLTLMVGQLATLIDYVFGYGLADSKTKLPPAPKLKG